MISQITTTPPSLIPQNTKIKERLKLLLEDKKIEEMSFSIMKPFPENNFKLYEGQRLANMVASIKELGILLHIILWYTENHEYIILSGHNRKKAGMLAGLIKSPVIVKENLTYEEATLIVTETNLQQRSFSELSHSQRALCLSQRNEAMKKKGKRNDIIKEVETLIKSHNNAEKSTSSEFQTKLRTDEKLAQKYALSRDKVARYIRLSNVSKNLISMLDEGKVAFNALYIISYIENKQKHEQIFVLMKSENYKLDLKKAELLRKHDTDGKLDVITIEEILSGKKTSTSNNQNKSIKINSKVIKKYFSANQSKEEIEKLIENLIVVHFSQPIK